MSEYSINIDDITKKLDPFPKDKDLPNLKGRLGIITAHLQDLLSDFDSLLPTKVRQEFEMMEKVGVFDYYNLSAWSEKERALKEKIREKRYGLERRLFSGYPPVYDECEFSEEDAIADIAGLDKRLKRYKRFLEKRYGRRIESVIDFHKLKELTELRALLLDQYDRAIDTAGFIEKLEERLLPGSEKNKEIEFDIALWTDERLFPYANNAVNLFMQIADYIRYFDCVPWYLAYPDQYEMLLDDGYFSEEEAKEEEDDVLWEPYDNCLKRKIIRSGDMYSIRQLVFFSEIFRKARQGKLTLEEAFYVHPKTFWGFHEHDELKKVLGLESLWEGVNDNPFFVADSSYVEQLEAYMDDLRKSGDSIGARLTVVAENVPVGWGEPVYDRLDAEIAHAMMGINAVKGVEIGAGFASVIQRGSEHGDEMTPRGFLGNHAGDGSHFNRVHERVLAVAGAVLHAAQDRGEFWIDG